MEIEHNIFQNFIKTKRDEGRHFFYYKKLGYFSFNPPHEKLWLGLGLGLLGLGLGLTLIALITLTLTIIALIALTLTLALTIIFHGGD